MDTMHLLVIGSITFESSNEFDILSKTNIA